MPERAPLARTAAALAAILCLLAGAALAREHPLAPGVALALFALSAAAIAWRPGLWLLAVPAALPVLNFAPWTGGLVVEEFDLLILAVAGGAYARLALDAPPAPWLHRPAAPMARAFGVAALLFGLASIVSLNRGIDAAGGLSFGWFQGETEPLNGWRVVKSMVGAALLWPLLRREIRRDAAAAVRALGDGMLIGVGIVALMVVWERAAYPGLLNFSGPYRATALFWEMHVGGAAIDAYLALATPFVVWALWAARTRWRWGSVAVLALLTGYACLTTFARGLYFAVAAPLALLGVATASRQADGKVHAAMLRRLAIGAAFVGIAVALTFAFEAGGYLGAAALGAGLAGAGLVAARWVRPMRRRSVAVTLLTLALVLEVVAVLGWGTFMRERIAASEDDLGSRLVHWRNGFRLLREAPDWAWGIGAGRLPAEYAAQVPRGEFPGTVTFTPGRGDGSVTLSGPKTRSDIRGLFALTQRVALRPGGPHRLAFDVRVERPTVVLARVCEMHLLYPRECQRSVLRLLPQAPWRHVVVDLRGPPLSIGEPAWPRRALFSIAVLNAGGAAEFDKFSLLDPSRHELLVNGDFAAGLSHWFPVAQSHFLPWHIDNFFLEMLIERGLVASLALWGGIGIALACLLGRAARATPVAPFLAASLGAALCVGMVSSVMDVPRVAFLLLLLLVFSVELTSQTRGEAAQAPHI